MVLFYEGLAAGARPAGALRDAVLKLREGSSVTLAEHLRRHADTSQELGAALAPTLASLASQSAEARSFARRWLWSGFIYLGS